MHPTFPTTDLNQSEIQYVFTASGEVLRFQNYGFDMLDEYNNIIPVLSSYQPPVGKQVEVLGTLQPSGYFKSIKVVVVAKWGYESLILRSIIGLIVISIVFLWYWKFDFKKLEFIARREK